VRWRGFPLKAGPAAPFDAHTREVWREVQEELRDDGVHFGHWPATRAAPGSSLPPLLAAVAARPLSAQGFRAFHQRLFSAYYEDCLDISSPSVLARVAVESGLDGAAFARRFGSPDTLEELRSDFERAAQDGVDELPLTIITPQPVAPGIRFVGAAPFAQYRRAVSWLLRS
jgi:predicted DsbA family dithiol-disulfide isomerase